MRVLHIVHSLEPGGMENGVVNVSATFDPAQFEIHACCLARAGAFAERFPNSSRVHVLGKPEGFSIATVAKLASLIRTIDPGVIHTHNFGPLIYAALAAPGRAAQVLHGEHAELTPAELTPRRRLIRRILYNRVRRVHTVSCALRDSLVRQGFPAGKIEVVINGVDTTRFSPGSREEARRAINLPTLPQGALLLGLVGRFGPFKRHAELIQAFEQLAPAHPSLALLFVGANGPLEEETRHRAAQSPFASRIHFAGFQRDPLPWYRALDLLVIPSINEGLSNALLEAMSCGIPALAHTACGNDEVIHDASEGFVRDLSSPAQLRDALATILANPTTLPATGSAARKAIESRFSFQAMVAGYETLYHAIAKPDLVLVSRSP